MSSSSTETLIDVTMPQMGVSVAEGTVVEWKKQPGDWVEADEIIAAISTDKIDTDVEAPATGRVQELLVDVGATVEVGTVLARIATDARPGEPHRSENAESAGARFRRGIRWRRIPQAEPTRIGAGAARRPAALLAGRDADRHRAWRRPRAGRGHRARRPCAQAGRAGLHRGRRRRRGAADAHREPVPARRAGGPEGAQAADRAAGGRRRHRLRRGAPRCRACARRSARGCWSRCRRRPPARPSSRPTS